MKKGINFWSYPAETRLKNAAETAKKAGFDGIEYCLAESGELSMESSVAEVKDLRKMTLDSGLEISSLASWVPWENSLTSNDPAKREKAKDVIKKLIDTAGIMQTDTVLVVPGYVGVDFIDNCEICNYEEVYNRALEAISSLSAYAKDAGIVIGIENVWNKFLLSPLEFRDFIDKIDSDYVGAYFDVGNVILTGYPEQWIRILGKRIKKVHFKDYRREPGGFGSFVDLLSGDVNYPEVMKAFKDVGYDGYVNAEMMPPYNYYSDQIIFNTSASMDRIIKG